MSKRFSTKDLEAAMGKTKADPDQGFRHGGEGDGDKTFCRTEPLGTLKPKKGKGKKAAAAPSYQNKFTDDGKLEQKYSIKKNKEEAKLVSTVGPREKRQVEEVELVDVECAGCGETFQENPAFISTEYYRCNGCCKPSKAQKRRKRTN